MKTDIKAASDFLDFLGDALGVFAFQTYDDDMARKDAGRARTRIGKIDEHAQALADANRDRAAVHVTINDTDGKRRTAANVIRVRKHFVEIDGAHDVEKIRSIARDVGLDVAWINESSPGKFHVYFNVAADVGADVRGFTLRQKQLAALFDGGRESVDPSRVLRLPGFHHRKGEPFMVRAVYKDTSAREHTLDDFDMALPRIADITVEAADVEHEEDQAAIDRAIEHFKIFPEAVSDTPNGKMGKKGNNQTYDAMAAAKDFGVDEATCLELALDHYNPRCKPEWSFEELQTLVRNAYAYTKSAQGSKHPQAMAEKAFADVITDDDIEASLRGQYRDDPEEIPTEPGIGHNSGGIVWTNANDVKVQNVDYIWIGRLARGKHSLIAGEAGEGKSQILCYITARITRGEPWPAQGYIKRPEKAPQGYVIILSAEDDPMDTLVPRLIAAGADLNFVRIIKAVKGKGGDRKLNLETDMQQLRDACKALGNVVMIGIDPVSSYMGGKIEGGKNIGVRHVLDPLSDLAAELRCAILSITHFRKGAEGARAVHRIMDSIAFGAAPRATFGVYPDPTDVGGEAGGSSRRLLLPFKINLPDMPKGLAYHIEEAVGGIDERDGRKIKTLKVVWEGATDLTADNVQRMENEQRSTPRLDEAVRFFELTLADNAMTVADAQAEAAKQGIKEDTMRRALRKLGVKARIREGSATKDQPGIWEYPAIGE